MNCKNQINIILIMKIKNNRKTKHYFNTSILLRYNASVNKKTQDNYILSLLNIMIIQMCVLHS